MSVVPVASSPHLSGKGQRLDFGQVKPGATVRDTVVVRNIGDQPAKVRLYAADASTARGGGLAFGLRSDPAIAVGRWMRLGSSELTVPPRGSVPVGLSLTLPSVVQGGEYAGGVVAEQVSAPSTAGGVTQVYRFAMAVYVTVPGGAPGATPGRGSPDGTVELVDVTFPQRDGEVCPELTYRNSSQAIVNPDAGVDVDGRWLGGGDRRDYPAIGAVLPEGEVTTSLPCQEIPVTGARIVVRISGPHVDPDQDERAADLPGKPFALTLALLLLLLLIAVIAWWVIRERRRRSAGRLLPPGAAAAD